MGDLSISMTALASLARMPAGGDGQRNISLNATPILPSCCGWGDEAFPFLCISNWRLRGIPKGTQLQAEFKWHQGLGWESLRIVGQGVNLTIKASTEGEGPLLTARPSAGASAGRPFGPVTEQDVETLSLFAKERGLDLIAEAKAMAGHDEEALAKVFRFSLQFDKLDQNARTYGQIFYSSMPNLGEESWPAPRTAAWSGSRNRIRGLSVARRLLLKAERHSWSSFRIKASIPRSSMVWPSTPAATGPGFNGTATLTAVGIISLPDPGSKRRRVLGRSWSMQFHRSNAGRRSPSASLNVLVPEVHDVPDKGIRQLQPQRP